MGKHTLTRAYLLFLAHWARKLSWQETARSFHTSWEKVPMTWAILTGGDVMTRIKTISRFVVGPAASGVGLRSVLQGAVL